ncbi:MAG: acyltransferase family protein, partial [Bradyrhizobium sp.]
MGLSYRGDIDYVRAVAVLAVIGFHYGVPGFDGGFVGVDIFFVISGYLISRLIWAGLRTDSFSFRTFYDRRARRLLPALYVTLVGTGVVAWFLAPPDDYRMFFGSAVSTLLFSSNIFFWFQTGYFDLPTIGKVLIHTWSLSVEEQFYFMFPVLTWIWSRLFRDPSARLSLILVVVSTLLLCVADELVLTKSAPAAFYLSPLRAWEFLVGTIAFLVHDRSPENLKLRYVYALTGAALMLLPVMLFHAETRFPGLHALIPCLGTALFIIAFNKPGESPKLPAERLGLFVGRISYSLYLLHWPVFVLGTAAMPPTWSATPALSGILFAVSLCLAILLHYVIEEPARSRVAWRRIPVSGLIAASAVVLVSVSAIGLSADGYPARFAASDRRMLRYNADTIAPFYREHSCFLQPSESFARYAAQECLTFAENKKNVLLFGDSTAAHYVWGLRQNWRDDANLLQLNSASCRPSNQSQDFSANCDQANAKLRELIRGHRLSGIILAAHWRPYMRRPDFEQDIGATLAMIEAAGIPVLLIGPPLEFPALLPP